MNKYKTARIITVAIALIVVAVTFAAMFSIARFLFFPDNTNVNAPSEVNKTLILNTSADRSVSMNVRGPITADDTFRSYQIKISPNSRSLITYKGYKDEILNSINLPNNIPAYEEFVYALYKVDLMKGTELSGNKNDLRGVCATGSLYEFKILNADKTDKLLWTTTCSRESGSLGYKLDPIVKLFNAQIPDAKLTTGKLWR